MGWFGDRGIESPSVTGVGAQIITPPEKGQGLGPVPVSCMLLDVPFLDQGGAVVFLAGHHVGDGFEDAGIADFLLPIRSDENHVREVGGE